MKAVQELTPHIQKIKEMYKDDYKKMQTELALQYKKSGVNPLGGFLPVLLQMPILAGMYYAIQSFSYVGQPKFLWMKNIAIGDPLYIIPVLVALSTFVLQKNSNTNKGIGFGLAIFIGVMSVHLPAGLGIYWISGNLIQWGQKYFL
jgi:YidC/Oxa1 family membrane protein insertase